MLEKLNTPGGHILVFFALILTGIGMYAGKIPRAEEITFGSFTALLAVLAPQTVSSIAQLARGKQPIQPPATENGQK